VRWTLALAGLASSWGLVAVIVDAVELGAPSLAFLRLVIAAITLGVIAAVARADVRPHGRLPALVLLGVLQASHWLLFFEAVKLGSVALAVLTFYTAPIILAAAAPPFLGEATSRVVLAGLPIGAIGIMLVSLAGDQSGGHASPAAIAAGLGSAATYAAIVLVSKQLLRDGTPPLTVALWDCAIGAVVLLPVLAFAEHVLPSGVGEWSAVLALGVVFTGLSTLAYAVILRHVSAQAAGLLTFLEPVSAVVLAALLLDDPLTAAALVGGLLVVLAGITVIAFEPEAAPELP
jgi:DME family drug/metabolite transporter